MLQHVKTRKTHETKTEKKKNKTEQIRKKMGYSDNIIWQKYFAFLLLFFTIKYRNLFHFISFDFFFSFLFFFSQINETRIKC